MDGALAKLTVLPFADVNGVLGPPAGPPFLAQYNPETYTDTVTYKYDEPQARGGNGGEAKFDRIEPKKYAFELILDGTGAGQMPGPMSEFLATGAPPLGLEVPAMIELFKATVGFSGNIHRPRFLMLVWGRLVATTVLETYSVKYTLFNPAGLPIRATLSVTFREHTSKGKAGLINNLSSPDVAHGHEVREGDRLPDLAAQVYGDPAYCVELAAANGLDSLRALEPGSAVYLPPLEDPA